jgi:Putative papain-like cysteine peptidase (DUF1796)/Domain of unknown function (DUF4214)
MELSSKDSPGFPIAILSFNRPHYLENVLRSLQTQTLLIRAADISLFQDGYLSKAGRDLTDPKLVERCVELFETKFPGSKIFLSKENLGVARNFARAEDCLFGQLRARAAFFFEDDLVLSPNYLTALHCLTEIALKEKRIAYVAAYGNHRASLEEQRRAACKLIPMHHKWGFALTRSQWNAQRDLLKPYLEIVSRSDYRDRDHDAIRAYFRDLGYGSLGTSQDAMKDVASCVLGTTKVMTFACFGKYIGEVGLHSQERLYDQEKFRDTEIYLDQLSSFEPPSSGQLDEWVAAERANGKKILETIIQTAKSSSRSAAIIQGIKFTSGVELSNEQKPSAANALTTRVTGGSPEEHWVAALYRVLLGREPDPPGLLGHVRAVQAGWEPEDLVRGFLQSQEFAAKYLKFAKVYGQSSHQISPTPDATQLSHTANSEPRYSVETLVEALYRGVLSRAPDQNGFVSHVRRLGSLSSDAADLTPFIRGFLASREYQDQVTSQIITRLFGISTLLGAEPIDFVSLGSHCLVSYTLKEMGLKRYSCPFDWIFSRPSMIEHCLKDSFALLADRSQYKPVIDETGNEQAGRCHHAFYKASFGVDRVFNQRDMRIEENYQYLLRCIRRFTQLLKSVDRKIFVLLCPSSRITEEHFLSLHETLTTSTSNFSIFAVILNKPAKDIRGFGLEYIKRIDSSCLAAMHPISKAGSFTFEDPFDDFMLRRAIVTFAASTEKPLPVEGTIRETPALGLSIP